jgi:transposase
MDEIVLAIWDQFEVKVAPRTVGDILLRHRWSRKVSKRRALEANGVLRAMFKTKISRYSMDKLVFLDESASNERTGYRKRGWAPVGVDATDLVTTKWYTRWSILPALTIEGYLPGALIYQGSVNQAMFNWFVKHRVLPLLKEGSVLVLDNASIHRDLSLVEMVHAAGFELIYLPPYSPDLNPIEQTFNVLKAWIRRNIAIAERFSDFGAFLTYAVEQAIGEVEGHYRESGYSMQVE